MQAIRNDSSTTTKIRVVFDASARSSSGVSLSDTLLVGPTIHLLLVDVLLQFQLHHIALIADISKMYRTIELAESDRDFHHFVWRTTPSKTLQDYCITRVTFGISPSPSLQACQAKCNWLGPQVPTCRKSDWWILLCRWRSDHDWCGFHWGSNWIAETAPRSKFPKVVSYFISGIPMILLYFSTFLQSSKFLRPCTPSLMSRPYTKTLGIEWNANLDHFQLTIADLPPLTNVTKRLLFSDITKMFDVLG